jgi:hypothetical protein
LRCYSHNEQIKYSTSKAVPPALPVSIGPRPAKPCRKQIGAITKFRFGGC